MNSNNLRTKAETIPLKEILESAGWEEVSNTLPARIDINHRRWQIFSDGEQLTLETFGESDMLISTIDGQTEFHSIPKYDLIRYFHFDEDSQLANRFLQSSNSLARNMLTAVGKELAFRRRREIVELTDAERYVLDDRFRASVDKAEDSIRISEEAKFRNSERKAESERRDEGHPESLTKFLEENVPDTEFVVEGLIAKGSNTSIVASAKTGKTTLVFNLLKALADGEDFLGRFRITDRPEQIGYLNLELTRGQANKWFRKSKISNSSTIHVWNLREKLNPFRSESSMRRLADDVRARGITFLVIDPFSGIFKGDTNNNDEVKQFLLSLDLFKSLAGISEIVLVVHAGRDAFKTRGASSLDDHPDALIYLYKEGDTRFLRAIGRDIHVPDEALNFDHESNSLWLSGANPRDARVDKISLQIFDFVKKSGKATSSEIEDAVTGSKSSIKAAREKLVATGNLLVTRFGNANIHQVGSPLPPQVAPQPAITRSSTSAPLFIGGGGTSLGDIAITRCQRCESWVTLSMQFADELFQCIDCQVIIEIQGIEL